MKIADLYVRVSTDEQADRGYSQRDQEERLRRYCEINSIQVRKVIYEDHSAKTFNRPQWTKLLLDLRKHRGQADIILFTKWDRFSRNAGDAYQMISILRRLGVEPQAVEQPLDLSIPENKMMLAFYLAAPEVENDRRALNVFHGMRRAKKEGRWMGTAPVGYCNKVNESGRKYIAPKEGEANTMQWVFRELAAGKFNTEQIWKMAKEKGLKCSKNNFWVAIRNPVYCGKIFIPKYKEEEGRFIEGQHEAIISESLFNEVQETLDGRKKAQRTKISADAHLPLRGFLTCPKCGRMLTGSASKGRKLRYYYYHCTSACGTRFKADNANQLFIHELKKYVPKPGMNELYAIAISNAYKQQTREQNSDRKQIMLQLEEQTKRLQNAREMAADKLLELEDFRVIKTECTKKIDELESKLAGLPDLNKGVDKLLKDGIGKLSHLDVLYENGTIKEKREIIGSMFPDNLTFDGFEHRTTRMNEAARLIYLINNDLEDKKNGTNTNLLCLSHQVIPLGLEPRAHTLKVYCSTS
jgi:site-specific DNA recombinase